MERWSGLYIIYATTDWTVDRLDSSVMTQQRLDQPSHTLASPGYQHPNIPCSLTRSGREDLLIEACMLSLLVVE